MKLHLTVCKWHTLKIILKTLLFQSPDRIYNLELFSHLQGLTCMHYTSSWVYGIFDNDFSQESHLCDFSPVCITIFKTCRQYYTCIPLRATHLWLSTYIIKKTCCVLRLSKCLSPISHMCGFSPSCPKSWVWASLLIQQKCHSFQCT